LARNSRSSHLTCADVGRGQKVQPGAT
jgi:hypothetical protein